MQLPPPKKNKQKKNSKGLLDKSPGLVVSDCLQNCSGHKEASASRTQTTSVHYGMLLCHIAPVCFIFALK